jgi:hypothetical protein
VLSIVYANTILRNLFLRQNRKPADLFLTPDFSKSFYMFTKIQNSQTNVLADTDDLTNTDQVGVGDGGVQALDVGNGGTVTSSNGTESVARANGDLAVTASRGRRRVRVTTTTTDATLSNSESVLTISKTVGTAVDDASGTEEVTAVSKVVQVASLPEPTSSQESPRHLSDEIGVADKVLAESATSIGVVGAVSQLHSTTTSEAAATFVTTAPSVGTISVGVLNKGVVTISLVTSLGHKHSNTSRGVDTEAVHSVVDVRDPSRAALANTSAEHASESLLRDLSDGSRGQSQNSDEQQGLGHCGGSLKPVNRALKV